LFFLLALDLVALYVGVTDHCSPDVECLLLQ
jgi:hypothetical protein